MKFKQYENTINEFAEMAVDNNLNASAAADKLVEKHPTVRRRNAYKDLRHAIKKHQNNQRWVLTGTENYK